VTPTYPLDIQIGATLGGIANLAALTKPVPYPRTTPAFYGETQTLGDNTERGLGAATVIWHWDVLQQTARDQLRTFCTGASATVYIKFPWLDSADAAVTYQAVMVWPSLKEERDAHRRLSFDLEFRELVAQ